MTDARIKEIRMGRLTYAIVDDEVWYPAIVLDYKGCQDYDVILCGFMDQALPSERTVRAMMAGLIADNPALGSDVNQACGNYQPMGCDTNQYGEKVHPQSCYVCGMFKNDHK